MKRKASWLIPSKDEWGAMLVGGLYLLAPYTVTRMFLVLFFPRPLGYAFWPWNRPIYLLSVILSNPNSLIVPWGIPALLAFVLFGMLSGLLIYQTLHHLAIQRPLTSGDGWRAGGWVGAWLAIPLAFLFIIAPLGISPIIMQIADSLSMHASWRSQQYLSLIFVGSLVGLLITAVCAALGRLLLALPIEPGVQIQTDHTHTPRKASKPGCVGLLVLAFFTMYFYGDVTRLLSKIPLPPPVFMVTGDFGIVSKKPCGPPCFQSITPGVTSIQDAYLNLLKAGAPCRLYEIKYEPSAPVDREGISCIAGDTQINITSGQSGSKSNEANLLVDTITLQPPAQVTVGELIASYGPPDYVVVASTTVLKKSSMVFYYDRLQIYVGVPTQAGVSYALTPGATIKAVFYQTTAGYQESSLSNQSYRQPWNGYGTYTPNTYP